MSQPLIILGASARAAAGSALRAGYLPIAGDLYGDVDLRARCHAERVEPYPHGLLQFALQGPAVPWIYTGALENEPTLVDEIARQRVLWGNPGTVLRQVRDPWRLAAAVEQDGLRAPRLAAALADIPSDGRWLSKPLASCGGGRIHRLDRQTPTAEDGHAGGGRYFQQLISGQPCGAVYVAAQGQAGLLGVTRQLTDSDWTAAKGFQYAGSVGPLRLTAECQRQFRRLGQCLAAEFRLTGLFGVDAIVSADSVWPVEVNPRYTASVEVLERALGIHAIQLHAAACVNETVPESLPVVGEHTLWCGKAIVYATAEVTVGEPFTSRLMAASVDPWPRFADIPAPGTQIGSGQPVLSVLAEAVSEIEVEQQLRRLAADVRRWLSE
jgi:predicted ATP-grasp superfamily ATP-dependent carboligase